MHYHLKLSSSSHPDLNLWVSKLSKYGVLGVEMTRWTHRWLSPWQMCNIDFMPKELFVSYNATYCCSEGQTAKVFIGFASHSCQIFELQGNSLGWSFTVVVWDSTRIFITGCLNWDFKNLGCPKSLIEKVKIIMIMYINKWSKYMLNSSRNVFVIILKLNFIEI